MDVPIIDITPFRAGSTARRQAVAAAVDAACREIGFLVIAGHGVPTDLIAEAEAVSRAFFDLPLEEKLLVKRPSLDVTRGYIPLEAESVARSRGNATPGDLNESLMIGPVDVSDDPYYTRPEAGKHFAPNLWPLRPSALQPIWTSYYQTMARLAADLMELFAVALGLDDPHAFEDKIDRHISRLRVRNYPAPKTAPVPGQLRAGAHTDYGSLTILKTEDRPGGLQVHATTGEWLAVPVVPGAFIVNIGDLMARWTNDRWRSTLHRVVNPPADQTWRSRRQSLVFFHNPNYDALIECLPTCREPGAAPKYPAVTSGEHLRQQFTRTQRTLAGAYDG